MTAVLEPRTVAVDEGDAEPLLAATTNSLPAGRPSTARALLTAVRPRQWVKSVLVTAAPLAAGALTAGSTLVHVGVALITMCAAASATYLVNDLVDVERDRLHPRKRFRPIAAGLVSGRLALGAAAGAAAIAVLIGTALGTAAAATVVAYLALTISYSRGLKHVPFVELGVVAAVFVLRVVAGAAATTTPLPVPFLVTVGGGSLFLATGKRYAEVRELGDDAAAHRPVLGSYSSPVLERILMIAAATAVLGYAGWATAVRFGRPGMVWLLASVVPFLIAAHRGIGKVFAGDGGDPTELILGDGVMLSAGAATAVLAIAGLYLS